MSAYHVPRKRRRVRQTATCRRLENIEKTPPHAPRAARMCCLEPRSGSGIRGRCEARPEPFKEVRESGMIDGRRRRELHEQQAALGPEPVEPLTDTRQPGFWAVEALSVRQRPRGLDGDNKSVRQSPLPVREHGIGRPAVISSRSTPRCGIAGRSGEGVARAAGPRGRRFSSSARSSSQRCRCGPPQ
jgi:hypothetical protein